MSQATATRVGGESLQGADLELLVCTLSGEEFAFPLTSVREIIPLQPTTPVPHAPDSLRGVFNLRGKVATLLDLSVLLGLHASEGTHIVVCDKGQEPVGILVGMVSGIVRAHASELHAANEFLPASDAASFVKGAVLLQKKTEDGNKDAKDSARIILLLDTEKVLTSTPSQHTTL